MWSIYVMFYFSICPTFYFFYAFKLLYVFYSIYLLSKIIVYISYAFFCFYSFYFYFYLYLYLYLYLYTIFDSTSVYDLVGEPTVENEFDFVSFSVYFGESTCVFTGGLDKEDTSFGIFRSLCFFNKFCRDDF